MTNGLAADTSKSKLFSICEIRPYLHIAGYGALSHKKIKDLGITHAVDATNIHKTQRTLGVEYFEIKVDDNERSNIKQYFDDVASFIQKAKDSGGKALVYCAAGISRSAAICMMYLVISDNMTLRDAFIEVGKVRPIICPNLGFWRQMIDYEIEKRGETSVNLLNGMRHSIPDVYLYKSTLLKNRKISTLNWEEKIDVLFFFDNYDIQDLKDLLETTLADDISPASVVRIANYSITMNHVKFQERCMNFMVACLRMNRPIDDFTNLNETFVLKVLKNVHFNIV